ncbi:hypothetical protein BIW11_03696 [Tropilaelaps mercedesae]|uniref:Uncharacterized protein n=1 Tax=Tropilaelaps mercedesae TaxID=418985 RepID=A0A1V9XH95_9ACAR|nr:hypothetical protein BIW11_03696 [Tropilaelaps mercedesae]
MYTRSYIAALPPMPLALLHLVTCTLVLWWTTHMNLEYMMDLWSEAILQFLNAMYLPTFDNIPM